MSETKFDLAETRKEFRALRQRARQIERETSAQLRDQLRTLLTSVASTRDTDALLADVRAFLDQDEA